MFGGGFLSLLICFLATRNSKTSLSKFQFFIISSLIVSTMGVANEIIEFLLQNYTNLDFTFAQTINDTWLDLISNTIGALLGAILLTPFVRSRKIAVHR
jgi:glycopeptide antibiotics resistance protein